MEDVKLIVDCKNTLGECPVWSADEQKLYWTDIEEKKIWQLDPGTGKTKTWDMPEKVGSIAFRRKGGLLLAFESGISFYNLRSGEEQRITNLEKQTPNTRLNDGRCDRQGRFIVGGYDETAQDRAGVYQLGATLNVRELFRGVSSANSICFSLDGRRMYFADTPEGKIVYFEYDIHTGTPSSPEAFCTFEKQPGMPDGSIIDAEDCLWNAQWNGSRVVRYTPEGNIDRVIEMPCMNPTCVAFGGENLDTLFITSARFKLTRQQLRKQPISGGLFAVKPGVKGIEESSFSG